MSSAAVTSHVSGEVVADGGWSPDLRLLLGPDAGKLLQAVAAAAGGRLTSWRARQVNHQPGHSTVVQYGAQVEWPDSSTTSETFAAATGERVPRSGAAIFDDGETSVAVWRWPIDPYLPGLATALDPARVATLLDDVGIDGGALQLRTRAYRPGRRAVIEATGRRGRLFVKVVRPHRVEAIHQWHRRLAADLPVPDSLGWRDDGALVLTALPGQTLRAAMRSSNETLPPPSAVTALLDKLPADVVDESSPRDLLSTVDHHASVIAATVPTVRDRVDEVLGRLHDTDGDPSLPITTVHGDLYEAQLTVRGGHITGMLDIDTVGAGYRVDDLANFCAHLSVLALVSDRPKPIKRYGAALLTHAEEQHGRLEVRRRIAAAVIGLATGPFRVLEASWELQTIRRLDLAAEWLDGAGSG